MKARFTKKQIIRMLKEHDSGKKVSDIIRENSISEQTFYTWKSEFGGMEVSEAKRLRELKENHKSKELMADLSLGQYRTEEKW